MSKINAKLLKCIQRDRINDHSIPPVYFTSPKFRLIHMVGKVAHDRWAPIIPDDILDSYPEFCKDLLDDKLGLEYQPETSILVPCTLECSDGQERLFYLGTLEIGQVAIYDDVYNPDIENCLQDATPEIHCLYEYNEDASVVAYFFVVEN